MLQHVAVSGERVAEVPRILFTCQIYLFKIYMIGTFLFL